MFSDPLILLRLLAASAAFIALVWVFARNAKAGIVLLLCPGIIDVATQQQTPGAVFFDVTVSLSDVMAVCALIVTIGRLVERRLAFGKAALGVAALLTLVLLSVFRGLGDFGFQAALNESRSYMCFLASTLYIVTADLGKKSDRFAAIAWTAVACTYALLSVWGWSTTGITSSSGHAVVNGHQVSGRPVSAAAGLAIAQGGLLLITMCWRRSRYRALAAGLLLTVVLLQHRTVWIVTVVAIAAYLMLGRAAGRERLPVIAAVGFTGTAAYLGYSALSRGSAVGQDLQASYDSMQGPDSTLAWRVTGWQELLSEPRGILNTLFGHPLGSGFARPINGHTVIVAPHNWYVQTFLQVGLVGLVLFASVYVLAFLALRSGSRADLLGRLVLLTQLVFYITYSPFTEQGVALGLVLWHVRRSGAEDRPSPELEVPTARATEHLRIAKSR